jgi:hypothetical protein
MGGYAQASKRGRVKKKIYFGSVTRHTIPSEVRDILKRMEGGKLIDLDVITIEV